MLYQLAGSGGTGPLGEIPGLHAGGEQKDDTHNVQGAFEFVDVFHQHLQDAPPLVACLPLIVVS